MKETSTTLPPISTGQRMYEKGEKEKQRLLNDPEFNLKQEKEKLVHFHSKVDTVSHADSANYRTEREINLNHFRELLDVFKSAAKTGNGSINFKQFNSHFQAILGADLTQEQMARLFMQIDSDTNDTIDWNDSFMLFRAEGQKKMREEAESQLFEIDCSILHRLPIQTPHKEQINVIIFLKHIKRYISCSRDGTICLWSDRFKLQRCFKLKPVEGSDLSEQKQKRSNSWIHDLAFCKNISKFVAASDDHCISFYDFSTLLCNIRLNIGEMIPLTVDIWFDEENPEKKTMLVFGTDSGHVIVFEFENEHLFKQQSFKQKNKSATINLDAWSRNNKAYSTLTKRKSHSNWCVKARYFPSLRSIISCSPDENDSLVIAQHDNKNKYSFTSLSVHKGCNTFALCKFPAVLVSGGTDRKIRIWNSHRLHHPMAALKGHNSPIIDIVINETTGQIISLSTDKVVKLWDISKQVCVQTLADPYCHRPENTLSTIHFSPNNGGSLVCASYTLTPYQLKEKQVSFRIQKSHEYPLRAAIYNPEYRQIVSGDDGGVVNVWNPFSGQKTFRMADINGKNEEITAMAFDNRYRRLITGGRAGSIRIWNFNNGQPLHELIGDDSEYVEIKESDWIITTGWNRRVTMFQYTEDNYTIKPTKVVPDLEQEPWHRDDILSLAFSHPNIIATGSVDGEIIICNLVTGHLLFRMRPFFSEVDVINPSMDKVIYLTNRSTNHEAADLVSVGSDGLVRFWNTRLGYIMWEFIGSENSEGICAMCTDISFAYLFTADATGWVSVWNIEETCLSDNDSPFMPLLSTFRAHSCAILSLDTIHNTSMLVTASSDCTARVFNFQGEYVGTLGQSDLWDLTMPETYQHPFMPLDVVTTELENCQDEIKFQKLKVMSVKLLSSKRTGTSKTSDLKLDTTQTDAEATGSYDEEQEEAAKKTILSSSQDQKLPAIKNAENISKSIQRAGNNEVTRSLKTADLVQKDYSTWYSKSIFAQSRKPVYADGKRPKKFQLSTKFGIYHSLKPIELTEIGNFTLKNL